MKPRLLLYVVALFIFSETRAQESRRANLGSGLYFISKEKGVAISEYALPTSDLLKQGLQKGDSIIGINNKRIASETDWDDKHFAWRAGDNVELTVRRGEKTLKQSITFTALPKEKWNGLETDYSFINVSGKNVRVITTYPTTHEAQPALFVLGGLSCSSMELSGLARESGWALLLKDLITKSNMITMRVEKMGVGDSEGSCSMTDFNTEMETYRAALRTLINNKRVDKSKIILFGSSVGSMQSVMLANEFPAHAVVASGTFLKSWYEHTLETERRVMEMDGLSFSAIQSRMIKYEELYFDVLVRGKNFKEAVQDKPQLQEVKPAEETSMYGRPIAYYQELQQINVAGQWEKLKVPVMIEYGTADWIMSEEDNDMIVRLLKKQNADITYLRVEGMDHDNFIFPSKLESYKNYWSGRADEDTNNKMLEWMSAKVGTSSQGHMGSKIP
jgi:pimeloyl-ACP methyl ester carboxylesterase